MRGSCGSALSGAGAALRPFAGEPAPTGYGVAAKSCGSGFTREGAQSGPNHRKSYCLAASPTA
ncbi:MAG: hypothetical protein EOP15_06875, partial [Pseudomonas sp.]